MSPLGDFKHHLLGPIYKNVVLVVIYQEYIVQGNCFKGRVSFEGLKYLCAGPGSTGTEKRNRRRRM